MRRVEPSSISRAIAALEAELGERLFHRTTRRLALTEAGAIYLARVEPLLMQMDDARREIRSIGRGPLGTLRLSASVAYGQMRIIPLLGMFQQRYPDVTLELILSDVNLDLVGERIDLAIRLAPGVDANVIVSKLADTHYRVVASPGWLSANPLAKPDDLRQYAALRFTLPGYCDRWLFRGGDGNIEAVPVAGNLLISNMMGLRDAALAGLGPALLAEWMVAEDMKAGRLTDCFPAYQVTATEFETGAWMIYTSRSFLPGKVRAMIDFLREHLQPQN